MTSNAASSQALILRLAVPWLARLDTLATVHHSSSSRVVTLFVTEARAEIVGPQVKYLTPDSTLKLICRVVQSTEASAFIFWYHNNRMINYDLDRGINVSTEADFHYSELTISQASKEHSGNYTCVPSNSQPASVVVHIFKGDNPAAMYHEHRSSSTIPYRDRLETLWLLARFLMVLLVVRCWREADLAENSTHARVAKCTVTGARGPADRWDVAPPARRRTPHVQIYTDTDNHPQPPQELHQAGCHLIACF
uniref:Ig-like domain-containing protein n=1 Tax=Anopheles stephensi TaxID=30069 RepID=A0A182YJ42_ANOST